MAQGKPQTNVVSSTHRKLNVGVVGIGRMGQKHALNLIRLVPRANLVCASSPAEADLAWAAENLDPYGIKTYSTFEEMVEHPGLEAVVIASSTPLHLPHTLAALDKGLHVLCEKPVCTSIEDMTALVKRLEANPSGPKFMVGFVRRFDESYLDVKSKLQEGSIGRPTVMRTMGCEVLPPSDFSSQYLAASGGIFFDSVIHEIDLALHFLGEKSGSEPVPKSVSAHGVVAMHAGLAGTGDADNAVGVCEFWDGQVAFFYNSRMSAHGYDSAVEVFGTKGKLSVNLQPRKNRVEICDGDGLLKTEPTPGWYDRFEGAFATEMQAWTAAVLDGQEMPVTAQVALKSLIIATALQESLATGTRINFTKSGARMEGAPAVME